MCLLFQILIIPYQHLLNLADVHRMEVTLGIVRVDSVLIEKSYSIFLVILLRHIGVWMMLVEELYGMVSRIMMYRCSKATRIARTVVSVLILNISNNSS